MNYFFIGVGKFLKGKRKALGLSQGMVANKLGYESPQFVSNWERGLCAPPMRTLVKLKKIYHISTFELLNVMNEAQAEQFRSQLGMRTR